MGIFLVVYLEIPLGMRGTIQTESPVACLVVWDQVDPVPNNFHQTRVQALVLCKEFLINNIPLIQVMRHSSNLGHEAYPPPIGVGY